MRICKYLYIHKHKLRTCRKGIKNDEFTESKHQMLQHYILNVHIFIKNSEWNISIFAGACCHIRAGNCYLCMLDVAYINTYSSVYTHIFASYCTSSAAKQLSCMLRLYIFFIRLHICYARAVAITIS